MKKIIIILIILLGIEQTNAQLKFKYGATVGLNISSAILPELDLNTDINSLLKGDDVVQGNPQLANFISLYKIGGFLKFDGKLFTLKINANYSKTNIQKQIDLIVANPTVLDLNLSYLDFDIKLCYNIFEHFYFSAGYIPSFLLDNDGYSHIENFDSRILGGIGFRFNNGFSVDLDAVIGLTEVIKDSYIHNVMIPITLNIPIN